MKLNTQEVPRKIIKDELGPRKPPEIVGVAQDDDQSVILRFDSARNTFTLEWSRAGRTYHQDAPSFGYLEWLCGEGRHPSFTRLLDVVQRLNPARLTLPALQPGNLAFPEPAMPAA